MIEARITPTQIRTKITAESSQNDNPFLAKSLRTHGYEMSELSKNISFSQMIFLLFVGELPSRAQQDQLDYLMVSLSNPGPRNGAVRAAMTAAISKTSPEHLLPIGLHVLGGERQGVSEVIACATWLSSRKNAQNSPVQDIPGFGTIYGGKDLLIEKYLQHSPLIDNVESYAHLAMQCHLHMSPGGILDTGYCAALGLDLGFAPRECGALFQLSRSAGILAHAMEQTHHPISASTLLDDENYEHQL